MAEDDSRGHGTAGSTDQIIDRCEFDWPGSTDDERSLLRELQCSRTRLLKLVRTGRATPSQWAEYGRLRDEIDRTWAEIQRREASRLRPLSEATASVQDLLRIDKLYWLWNHQSENERRLHAQSIADLALASIWASHVHDRPNLVSDAVRPDLEAYRRLLFISRGIDPDSQGIRAMPTVARAVAPKRRHIIDLDIIDGETRQVIEGLLNEKHERMRALQDGPYKMGVISARARIHYGRTSYQGVDGPILQTYGLSSQLVAEAEARLSLERVNQELDRYSRRPPPLPGTAEWDPPTQLRAHPDVRLAVYERCESCVPDVETSETWGEIDPLRRSWLVNHVVLDLIGSRSPQVNELALSDIGDAAGGDETAWGALRAACEIRDESMQISPTPEVETVAELPPSLTGRRRVIVTLWREEKSEGEIASQLGIAPDSVAKRISEARSVYGDSVVPRRRSKRQPTDSLLEEQA